MPEVSYESTSRFIDVSDEVTLHYHDAGDGPALVLLHGGGPGAAAWSNFNKNIGPLSAHRRVLAFDLPQYGRSSKIDLPDNEIYPASYVKAVMAALDRLEVQRADFIGNSLGAGMACVIAHEYPERVGKLVLMGPGGVSESVMTPVPMDALRKMFTYYNPGPPSPQLLREILSGLLYDPSLLTDELVQQRYEASIEPETLRIFSSLRKQNLTNVVSFIHTVEHPALIVFGLEDRAIPLDSALMFAKKMPNNELLILPKAGHWVMWERAAEFNAAVDAFLAR